MGDTATHFLLVDDDALLLRALKPHLEPLAAGADAIACAQTPGEALRVLARLPPGRLVVLSDFNLKAERTGVELLQDVAQARPDALRLLMSGYDEDQLGLSFSDGVIHGFVEKPLYLHAMVPRVRDLVAKHWD